MEQLSKGESLDDLWEYASYMHVSLARILLTDFPIIRFRKRYAWPSCWPSSDLSTGSRELFHKTMIIMPSRFDGALFIAHQVDAICS